MAHFSFLAQSQISWNSHINIASSASGNNHPRIVTDASGNPLVIWYNGGHLMYTRWNGTAFEIPTMLNPLPMTVAGASWMGPDIAAHGDTVYIVYKGMPEHEGNIWSMHSFDGGQIFLDPVRVDNIGDSLSRFPTVTVDESGNPIIAFMKFDAGFSEARWVVTRSYDYGQSFSPDVLASGWSSQSSVVCDCCPGSIVTADNTVVMVYRDNKNNIRDTWAGFSTDGGESFTEGINVDGHNWEIHACPASGPDGVVLGDSLYSTFMNAATGKSLVYMNSTSLTDIESSASVPVTNNNSTITLQNFPRISGYNNALGVIWKQVANNKDQIVIRFTNDNSGGQPALLDTVDEHNIMNVDIAIFNGNIYVVWEDNNSGTVKFRSGTYEVITAVEEYNSNENITVYPNPSSDSWTISGEEIKSGSKVEIFNIHGQLVYFHILSDLASDVSIENSSLSSGVYFLKLSKGDSRNTIKLVKY